MYITYIKDLTVDQFHDLIQKILKSYLNEMKTEIEANLKEESNLVNIEVLREKLKVTKPTVYNWIKKGYIKRQKIGGRTLFDLPVILKSMKIYEDKLRRGSKDFNNTRSFL